MPIGEHGFLGVEAEQKRQKILQQHDKIFALLNGLNDVCHEYLRDLKLNPDCSPEVYAAAFFIRGLISFQSAVLLSERGLIEDVRVVCRTLLQVSFRIKAIAKKPTVIKRLAAASESLRRTRAKLFQSGIVQQPPNVVTVDWNAKIAEVDRELSKLGKSEVNDKELATIGDCLRDYYTGYPLLSDAAHASLADVHTLIKLDQNRKFSGFIYGPHNRQLESYALYAIFLQLENLIGTDEVIKRGLPARVAEIKKNNLALINLLPDFLSERG